MNVYPDAATYILEWVCRKAVRSTTLLVRSFPCHDNDPNRDLDDERLGFRTNANTVTRVRADTRGDICSR